MTVRRPPKVGRKTPAELELMRRAGEIIERTLEVLRQAMQPGVTTAELDKLAEDEIRGAGAMPSFKGYNGYPATICVEIEDVVVHGIPGSQRLETGTIVGIDVGCVFEGWHADAAFTVAIGEVDDLRRRLLDTAYRCLEAGVAAAQPGRRVADVSSAIQRVAEAEGFSVVRVLVGHGIGRQMHEPPQVPNYYAPGELADYEVLLRPGMTLAIEPMIAAGTWQVVVDPDGWTTRTADGSPSAHFEHTIAVGRRAAEILARGI
ncbi:MAG: type I methionyl aminopeptidase [Armatimonadetes bacterium]|nr:type I methionyl aminopeptidase [Armatimonadota bacterium]